MNSFQKLNLSQPPHQKPPTCTHCEFLPFRWIPGLPWRGRSAILRVQHALHETGSFAITSRGQGAAKTALERAVDQGMSFVEADCASLHSRGHLSVRKVSLLAPERTRTTDRNPNDEAIAHTVFVCLVMRSINVRRSEWLCRNPHALLEGFYWKMNFQGWQLACRPRASNLKRKYCKLLTSLTQSVTCPIAKLLLIDLSTGSSYHGELLQRHTSSIAFLHGSKRYKKVHTMDMQCTECHRPTHLQRHPRSTDGYRWWV